jgi:hypothetical protein
MKQLVWVILLAVGCHKEGTGAPGPGGQANGASPASATVAPANGASPASAVSTPGGASPASAASLPGGASSSPGQAPSAPTQAAAAPAQAPAAPAQASADPAQAQASADPAQAQAPTAPAQAAPATGDALDALDDFDRWLAPIWKLEGAARIQATCRAQHGLVARATTLQHTPAPAHAAADRWQEETTRLATTTGTLDLCCQTRDNSCLSDLHEVFVGLVALAPGAPPADRHKNDPAQADDAPAAAPAQPAPGASKALAAAQAAAAVLSAAAGAKATTPAALCKTGHDAVAAVEQMLNAPGLEAPASIAAEWSDQLGALLMNAGAFDGQLCPAGKPAAVKDIRDALTDLRDRAAQLVAIAGKSVKPAKAPTK